MPHDASVRSKFYDIAYTAMFDICIALHCIDCYALRLEYTAMFDTVVVYSQYIGGDGVVVVKMLGESLVVEDNMPG